MRARLPMTRSLGPALPLMLAVAFALGFAVNYGVPWIALGETGEDTAWVWAHQLRDAREPGSTSASILPASESNPAAWVLAGLVTGVCVSLLWVAIAIFGGRLLTPAREAAVASMLALPLWLVMAGAGRGLGLSFALGEGETRWSVSVAGIVLALVALVAAVVLGRFMWQRLAAQRIPALLLPTIVVAVGVFHSVPWLTMFTSGASPVRNTYRATLSAFRGAGLDLLAVVAAGLLVALLIGIGWALVTGLAPRHPRYAPLVDALFALSLVAPVLPVTTGAARFFGMGVAALTTTGDGQWGLSINALLFTALAAAGAYVMVRTLRESVTELGGASA